MPGRIKKSQFAENVMDKNITDEIHSGCASAAERAGFVRIDYDRIPDYAAALPLNEAASPELDADRHFIGNEDETVAFFLTLDAVNFGSGYFPHLRKRPGMSGYFTVASSLTDYYRSHGPLSADALARITAADCAEIFGQSGTDAVVRELMALFAKALNDLGNFLLNRFGGGFSSLVAAADGSAETLIRILAEMPFFNDVHPYKNLRTPFYKRAQLTAADLSIALGGKGLGRFHDLDRLTLFADNLVPHVLRVDGILVYDESLAARIESGSLIPAGSEEEIEIRACALHAVELIKAALNAAGSAVTSQGLDYLLWNRGQQPYYKAIPRHRTRCVYY